MSDACATGSLMRLEAALEQLFSQTQPVSDEELIPLDQALDRVLAQAMVSPMNIPGHDNSAMDGYALRLQDALDNHHSLPVVGTSLAGHPFNGELPKGGCVRIMTGAVIPEGADTVIMQEKTERDGDTVRFIELPEKLGNNIRRAGEDIAAGALVLEKGQRLRPQDIGLLASLGIAFVPVFRRLKVAVFSTGDELKVPGEALNNGEIYDSNRFVVKAMLQRLNVEVLDFGKIADDKDDLRRVFLDADEQADAIISSGGVSVGDADYTKEILDELGQTHFWKLAIKPGKPFAFGRLNNSVFFGLPGNPVSATVTFDLLAAPALRHMMNQQPSKRISMKLPSGSVLKKHPGRRDFQRGVLATDEQGNPEVRSAGHQGSGVLSTLSHCDGYIVLPEENGGVQMGETVTLQLFDELLR